MKRDHVLDVKLQSRHVRAARLRFISAMLAAVLGVAASVWVLWRGSEWVLDKWVFGNPAFDIRSIDVATDGFIPEEQVLVWAGVSTGENLLALDLPQVKRDLELQPWVESVAVERVLPKTLRIRVWERKPIAQISGFQPSGSSVPFELTTFYMDKNGYAMLPLKSSRRYAFQIPTLDPLPVLTGVRGAEVRPGNRVDSAQMRSALELVEEFERSPMIGLVDLVRVNLSVPGVLTVQTRQGSEVTFALGDFDRQFRRWRLIHDHSAMEGRYLRTLDLSVSNNIPARWLERDNSALETEQGKSSRHKRKHV